MNKSLTKQRKIAFYLNFHCAFARRIALKTGNVEINLSLPLDKIKIQTPVKSQFPPIFLCPENQWRLNGEFEKGGGYF